MATLAAAKDAIAAKNYDECLQICKQLLTQDAKNYNALVFSGKAAVCLQKWPLAAQVYAAARALQPDNVAAYQGLVELHLLRAEWNECVAAADHVLRLLPTTDVAKRRSTLLRQAYALEKLSRERDAVQVFRQLLVGAPKSHLPSSSTSTSSTASSSTSSSSTSTSTASTSASTATSKSNASSSSVEDYSGDTTMDAFVIWGHIERLLAQSLARTAATATSDERDAMQRELGVALEHRLATCSDAAVADDLRARILLRELDDATRATSTSTTAAAAAAVCVVRVRAARLLLAATSARSADSNDGVATSIESRFAHAALLAAWRADEALACSTHAARSNHPSLIDAASDARVVLLVDGTLDATRATHRMRALAKQAALDDTSIAALATALTVRCRRVLLCNIVGNQCFFSLSLFLRFAHRSI